MARDFDRNYGDYRSREYDRGEYDRGEYDRGNRGRGYTSRSSYRDDGRDLYSGGRYFYEGRTYASDRNQPGGTYGQGSDRGDRGYDRNRTYQDFTDRNFGTDYDRDRNYGWDRSYGPSSYDRNQSRYGYSQDYDRSRDWDYDRNRDYDRGYGGNERRRWDDAWNGYGYGPEDERRGMDRSYRSSYDRGDYNRGEFDRDRSRGSYMNRRDSWDQDYEPYRGGWQEERSSMRDHDSGRGYQNERDEDWGRRYDRNWGNSSFDPNRRRRETETY